MTLLLAVHFGMLYVWHTREKTYIYNIHLYLSRLYININLYENMKVEYPGWILAGNSFIRCLLCMSDGYRLLKLSSCEACSKVKWVWGVVAGPGLRYVWSGGVLYKCWMLGAMLQPVAVRHYHVLRRCAAAQTRPSLHTHTRAVNQNPTMQPAAVPAFRGGAVFNSLLQGGVQTIKALRSIDMIF